MSNEPNQMQLEVMPTAKAPIYANAMQVGHTRDEFILDFMNIFPPTNTLNARIITSPGHLKRIIAALSDNLKQYENTFGEVTIAESPASGIGFQTEK